jgi:hypothetical protein
MARQSASKVRASALRNFIRNLETMFLVELNSKPSIDQLLKKRAEPTEQRQTLERRIKQIDSDLAAIEYQLPLCAGECADDAVSPEGGC